MIVGTVMSAETTNAPVWPEPQYRNALYTRVVVVENAQNLKKVKGLDHQKPTKEALLDYFKQNGVDLKSPAYARFDEKTQALTVHATLADLDKVESLVAKLREMR
jgi:hypothetical protein